ncbi:hypothetical protein FSB78_08220 [Sphingomonas ginsenosidivorax]|uniref:Uncharacterized protein n=1 Tax=Sphingomonas ginsenosidivorax TaxID=862135 RepID=A0A5C6UK34_9SPHN|nr:hypothetical protein FSB78_08220 [Sphingomonas ginsenosidivorax]
MRSPAIPTPRHPREGGDPDWLTARFQPPAFEVLDPRFRGDDGSVGGRRSICSDRHRHTR